MGLMNRVLEIQSEDSGKEASPYKSPQGFLHHAEFVRRKVNQKQDNTPARDTSSVRGMEARPGLSPHPQGDTISLEGFQTDSEEALVQILQAVHGLPDTFLGLYDFFVLLRDVLSIEKSALLTPSAEDSRIFEPVLFWNLDQTSLHRLSFPREELSGFDRWGVLSAQSVTKLSSRDIAVTESDFICIPFPEKEPVGALLFSSPYGQSSEKANTLLVSALSQILSTNFAGIPAQFSAEYTPIPLDVLLADPQERILHISMLEIHRALREHFPMVSAQRIPEIVYRTLATLTECRIGISPEGFYLHLEAPFARAQDRFYEETVRQLCSWFTLDPDEVTWHIYEGKNVQR